jgi:acyl transferase domain-containing protein/acyl carrier protein
MHNDTQGRTREAIAIVGMGCRFPGAGNPAALWKLLQSGTDAIGPLPERNVGLEAFYDPTPGTPGKFVTLEGGFLPVVDSFDAGFFGISPREAVFMDPQQRLLLEVAWEAFEDAGIVPGHLAGTKVGVFVGMWTNEYEDYVYGATSDVDLYVTTGGGRHSASGRLSYIFDLQGPNLTLDTACSSSLVAIHLACNSLYTGESQVALAAGVNLILQPHISIGYSRSRMLSPRARCRFGDATADGYVRSEGVGLLVLKPLSRALADGDNVHAVILGSAVNNDGRGSGLLVAPSVAGQVAMLREAYRNARVSPGDVQYVEAHGTGTRVGDPVELQALSTVLAEGRPPNLRCLVGSIKTNIGHAEAASGMAGLVKTVLGMQRGVVPASLHLKEPNPAIPWATMPLEIPQVQQPWPTSSTARLAGVNSFGITGTNAHVVLAQAPVRSAPPSAAATRPSIVPVSAHTPNALADLARSYGELLRGESGISLTDVCHTASLRRTHHEHRATVVARSREEAAEQFEALTQGETRAGLASGTAQANAIHKVAFVFPGQGSQWLGMGQALLAHEPVFAAAISRCDAAILSLTGWSVTAELQAEPAASRLAQIDVVQPVLFSVQVALAALWRSWGVEPTAVVGHSMGEVAAACVAGALTLEDATRIICRRSELLKRTSGKGAMAVVELSLDEAGAALAGYENRLSVAVSNSSRSTVISGDPGTLELLVAQLEARDVFCRRIKVDVASHSPQMDPLKSDLLEALQGLAPRSGDLLFCSTVTAEPIETMRLTSSYWVQNLRAPVLFSQAIRRLIADGYDTFLEMSPHPLLVSAVQETGSEVQAPVIALPSLRRDEDELLVVRASVGALHCQGRNVTWAALAPPGGRVVGLPAFPWQRERFWFDAPAVSRSQSVSRDPLGRPMRLSLQPRTAYFEFEISTDTFPYLGDHRVRGAVVVPAAFFFTAAGEAAKRALGGAQSRFEGLVVSNALVLPEGRPRLVQLVIADEGAGRSTFQVLSQDGDATRSSDEGSRWVEHASGRLSTAGAHSDTSCESLDAIRARIGIAAESGAHYAAMSRRGLDYGPAFRAIGESWSAAGERLFRIATPQVSGADPEKLRARVALLDGCLQAVVAALAVGDEGDTFVPVSVARLDILRPLDAGGDFWVHVHRDARHTSGDDTFDANLDVFDGDGGVVASASGVRLQRIERELDQRIRAATYSLAWQPRALDSAAHRNGTWVVLGEQGPVARGLIERLNSRGQRAVLLTASSLAGVGRDVPPMDPSGESHAALVIASEPACVGVVDLRSLSLGDSLSGSEVPRTMAAASLAKVLATTDGREPPRLWLVTAGTQPVGGGAVTVNGSGLWGLRSVVSQEAPRLRCSACDLPEVVDAVTLDAFASELLAGAGEDEIALRGGQRFVRRLRRGFVETDEPRQTRPAAGRPYRAKTSSPGVIDALGLEQMSRSAPRHQDVEIEIHATGLNFMNVMSALGVYPGYPHGLGPLGIECAGRVVRVGGDVSSVREGDRVMAFAHHSLATHAAAHESLVRRIPDGMGFLDAATVPIAFLTAYYSLVHLGRIAPGERVLIHAAAGGVGLAAIQVAHAAGATVYATAGSEEKRDLLRALGVVHVADSRSLSFADDIRKATAGEGVDLVLNSLAGDAIPAGLSLLRSGGRFLEIGKRDIYENRSIGLLPFHRNLSYYAIDLDRTSRENPAALGPFFDRVSAGLAAGTYRPLPRERFPVARLNDAFRRMAQGVHTGKIVLEIDRETAPIETRHSAVPDDWGAGSVLITGGTGGLGLAIARWMVDQGARHLVLVSRRGAGDAASVEELRARGAQVRVLAGDVARADDVSRIVAEIDATMPPLRGVVHAAGILDDATIDRLTLEQFARVAEPKVSGAWNLHEATKGRDLDFFVLYSSVTAFIGSPGQANYAASNAVLDAVADFRRGQGLPAISIAWGPWSGVGLAAARADRGARLAEAGLGSISPALGVALFDQALQANPAHVAAMSFDVARWCGAYPSAADRPLFGDLVREASHGEGPTERPAARGIREALGEAPAGRRRRKMLEEYLQQQVAHVLKMAPSRVDVQKPLRTMGLDSLMGLELRNRLEAGTGASLPATLIWNYPTVSLLAPQVAARMGIALEGASEAPADGASPVAGPSAGADQDQDVEALLREIEGLTDDDARRLLEDGREVEP